MTSIRTRRPAATGLAALGCLLTLASMASAQAPASRVDLTFNHFHNYDELVTAMTNLANAYPELLTLTSIGKSSEGRDLWLMTINNTATGPDRTKPAMYIDGNVHGNEVQGGEVCLYTIWYLTKSYGAVEKITKMLDERTFYILPAVNPDGRAHWFDGLNTSHSSRSGKKPTDNDNDGLFDEDGYDDLDGDGFITTMWKKDPNGRFRRSKKDPRMFDRVKRDEKGDYSQVGSEGIDNDGDGDINEDGPGGYDMNRNWPSGWKPEYIQYGAGDYPFSYPETASIGRFLLDHPNVAAVQSYHNSGGMILRGPGSDDREDLYPREDIAAYDEIGEIGERILPYYRYMVLWKDLYTAHGGFVTWAWEGLGAFSFTNELWATGQMFYDRKEGDGGFFSRGSSEPRLQFGDLLEFGDLFVPLKPYDHPTFGEILIGGFNKYASRVPPTFMLEELCHRNFAFTMYHADQMPKLRVNRTRVKMLDPSIWEVTVEIANDRAIPSISAMAASKKMGARDDVTLQAAATSTVKVLASGTLDSWFAQAMTLTKHQPRRIWVDRGIGGHSQELFRWIVEGEGAVDVRYASQKGGTISRTIQLVEGTVLIDNKP